MNLKQLLFKAFIGGYWSVAYRKKGDQSFIPLNNQKYFWHADPFILEKDNSLFLFTEMYDTRKDIGRISCSKIIYGNSEFTDCKIVVSEKTHLSFPFIYKKNMRIYLMIESSQSNKLPLYEITNDCYNPIFVKNIYSNESFVDCCLLDYKDRTLLFGYSEENKSAFYTFINDDFSVISEPFFFSKSNIQRPAGAFCYFGRPAQYNINKYGEKIVFFDYELVDNEYKEVLNQNSISIHDVVFAGNKKIKAKKIHTYNCSENYEVIDFFVEKFDIFRWFKMLRRKRHKRNI